MVAKRGFTFGVLGTINGSFSVKMNIIREFNYLRINHPVAFERRQAILNRSTFLRTNLSPLVGTGDALTVSRSLSASINNFSTDYRSLIRDSANHITTISREMLEVDNVVGEQIQS